MDRYHGCELKQVYPIIKFLRDRPLHRYRDSKLVDRVEEARGARG